MRAECAARGDIVARGLGDIDHGAFVREAHALLAKQGPANSLDKAKASGKFAEPMNDIQVDGDTATGRVGPQRELVKMEQRDGRWYAHAVVTK